MNELEQILSGLQSIGAELKKITNENKVKSAELAVKLAEVEADKVTFKNRLLAMQEREANVTLAENIQEARKLLDTERNRVSEQLAELENKEFKLNEEYQSKRAEAERILTEAQQVKASAISFQKALDEEKRVYKQKILESIANQK